MKKTTLPIYALLASTVAGINFKSTDDLESARFARRLAEQGEIEADKITEALVAVNGKIGEVEHIDSGRYVTQIKDELVGARIGLQAQFDYYKTKFMADTKSDETIVGNEALDVGQDETDPAFAVGHIAGRKPNGAVHPTS